MKRMGRSVYPRRRGRPLIGRKRRKRSLSPRKVYHAARSIGRAQGTVRHLHQWKKKQ
jgi:hypothetical protein